MTFVATLLLGLGVLFIGSAMDNSSLADTFNNIINDKPINWSGTAVTKATVQNLQPDAGPGPVVPPDKTASFGPTQTH